MNVARRSEEYFAEKAASQEARSPMESVQKLSELVAPSPFTVLLLGESSVGKELVAARIHVLSPRADRPFVRVRCTGNEAPFEAQLFGVGALGETASFIEVAHGGTLFLDEVGEMALETQERLLRVLERRELRRSMTAAPTPIDIRLIVATSSDLDALVAAGRFRKDLLLRLNALSIRVPSLRERRGEILELGSRFLRAAAQRLGVACPVLLPDAEASLLAYEWPGNVRELEEVMDRACQAGAPEGTIRVEHLQIERGCVVAGAKPDASYLRSAVAEAERISIVAALKQSRGHQSKAAALLGISRRTLINRLEEYGLPRPRKRVAIQP